MIDKKKPEESKAHKEEKILSEVTTLIKEIDEHGVNQKKNNRYPDQFKSLAVTMHKNMGMSMENLGKLFKVGIGTIHRWVHDDPFSAGEEMVVKAVEDLKNRNVLLFTENCNRILQSVSDEKIDKADLKALMVSAKVAADGAHLIESGGVQKVLQIDQLINMANSEGDEIQDIEAEIAETKRLIGKK